MREVVSWLNHALVDYILLSDEIVLNMCSYIIQVVTLM